MRRPTVFALALLVLSLVAGCGGSEPRQFLSIGTGSTGGIYYPFGGALASRLSLRLPDRQFTAEVTAASVENVNRLQQGQIDIGMAIAFTIQEAYSGGPDFPEPVRDLRVVAPMWPNPLNLLVPEGSEIGSIAQLEGRTVSVGAPGSGTEMVARGLLAAYGLDYGDVEERFLSFTESSAGVRDGSVDAAFLEVAFPAAAVMEATTTGGAGLVPIEGSAVDAFMAEHPYFYATTVPGGVYSGIDEPVPTIAELNWVVALEDLSAEVVTAVLDILAEERERLVEINPAVGQIDLERLRSAPIPLHPATEAWMMENMPLVEETGEAGAGGD